MTRKLQLQEENIRSRHQPSEGRRGPAERTSTSSLTLLPPGDDIQQLLVFWAHRLVIVVTVGMRRVKGARRAVTLTSG